MIYFIGFLVLTHNKTHCTIQAAWSLTLADKQNHTGKRNVLRRNAAARRMTEENREHYV